MPADALQRGQHLGDGGAAAFERLAERALAVVQRLEPRLGLGDPVFGVAQPRGAVDQGLVELAAVLADGVDLVLELGFGFGGLPLLGADRLELLVALAQRIERGLGMERRAGERARSSASAERRGQRARRIGGAVPKRSSPSEVIAAASCESNLRRDDRGARTGCVTAR